MSVNTNASSSSRKARKARTIDPAQLGLFDAPMITPPPERHPSVIVAPAAPSRRPSRAGRLDAPRMVTVDDIPKYPPELQQSVDRMLVDLGSGHNLMTYRAIKECFGISRATVARRVKEGLVPGVRIANGRVLDDGPIRRFDRTQIRWLLLAVRFAKRRE
jgi:hypothetical protein